MTHHVNKEANRDLKNNSNKSFMGIYLQRQPN